MCRSGFDRSVKWRQVNFPQQLFRNIYGVVVASAFHGAIGDKVLRAGNNALRIGNIDP